MSPLNKELENTLIESEAKIFMLLYLSLIFNKTSPAILMEKTIDFSHGKKELILPMSQKIMDFLDEIKQETIEIYCKARGFNRLPEQKRVRENLNSVTDDWVDAMLIQAIMDGLVHAVASSCGEGVESVVEKIMEFNETASSAKETLSLLKG